MPAPDGVSTEVTVVMAYDVPGGSLGKAVATYFGEEPSQQLDDDLRRLKQVLETGEVVRSDGRLTARRPGRSFRSVPRNRSAPRNARRWRRHEGELLERTQRG